MKLILGHVSSRQPHVRSPDTERLVSGYIQRASRYLPTTPQLFHSETALLDWLDHASGRTVPHTFLLDSRGQSLSSTAFAQNIGRLRDTGTQQLVFAIGPPDGWSSTALTRADTLLSLGPMTMPHELARVVLAEQIYRALTILAGHPYHLGH